MINNNNINNKKNKKTYTSIYTDIFLWCVSDKVEIYGVTWGRLVHLDIANKCAKWTSSL